MSYALVLLFLFFMGSLIGWVLELFYRRFFSKNNPTRKWINPGFLTGPYVPLYGNGLCALFLLATVDLHFTDNQIAQTAIMIVLMTIAMTVIEYIAGLIFIKGMHIKLWDYSDRKGNIQGIICPTFSFYWGLIGTLYYFFIHPHIIESLIWLSNHLAFSFVIGFFYGVFCIDAVYSFQLMAKVRALAKEHEVIIRVEEMKQHLAEELRIAKKKRNFLLALYAPSNIKAEVIANIEKFSSEHPFRRKR